MNRLYYVKYIIICLLILSPLRLNAQQPVDSNALAGDSTDFESLRLRAAALSDKETNINNQLDDARKVFSEGKDAEQDRAASLIMMLEQELFNIRNQAENIATEISAYEAIHGKQIMAIKSGKSNNSSTQKRNLTENDYFRNNLTAEVYETLIEKHSLESKVGALLSSLKNNYDNLAILVAGYELAGKGTQADSIYSRIVVNAKKNELLAEEAGDLWGDIFETKIYTYNYLLDKLGESELLAGQEAQMNNLYMLEEETAGEYMYDAATRYALQKLLLVGYEIRIAENAGLTFAADSLKAQPATTSHINDYFMPKLDLTQRVFYDFADVSISRPAKYTSAWQLPEVSIYSHGSMYRILVGIYSRPPQIAVFKGVYPLAQEKKTDGKYYYYAGGYSTSEQAVAGVAKLKGLGFSNPTIVVWHNGEYDQSNSKTPTAVSKSKNAKYRIEIKGANEGLNRTVRDLISNGATGKEISRITSPENGEQIYVIGAFSNKSLAESLSSKIKSAQPEILLNIVQIEY